MKLDVRHAWCFLYRGPLHEQLGIEQTYSEQTYSAAVVFLAPRFTFWPRAFFMFC